MKTKTKSRKKIIINYETQYIYGVKVVCKDWVPKDKVITVSSPDEHGLQEVVITQII